MTTRSHAVHVLSALTCLGASWSCGGRDSPSDRTAQVDLAQVDQEECSPIGVKRKDYFLHIVSTLPRSFGERAKLDIHRVSPVYKHGRCTHLEGVATHAVILVHGAATEAVTTFDLRFPGNADARDSEIDEEERDRGAMRSEYSLMESLARAGVETFAVNQLGYGFSTRFQLDDPCNTSQSDQLRFLVPNPLEDGICHRSPDPFRFTNTDAARDQLAVVVNHVLEEVDVKKVSFFSWSRGGNGVGAYTSRDPSKVWTEARSSRQYLGVDRRADGRRAARSDRDVVGLGCRRRRQGPRPDSHPDRQVRQPEPNAETTKDLRQPAKLEQGAHQDRLCDPFRAVRRLDAVERLEGAARHGA